MNASAHTLSSLEEVLGRPIFSLSAEWFAHHRSFMLKEWEPFLSEHGYEISYVTDEEKKPGKIYILTKNAHGDYTGIWVDPTSPYDLAILNEDYDRALGLAEQRLRAHPHDARALFDKAYALSFLDRPVEALFYYDQVLALEPYNAAALNNKANVLSSLDRDGEAIVFYKHALEQEPHSLLYKNNLACSYLKLGLYPEYLKLKEEIFNSWPTDVEDRLMQHNLKRSMGWHTQEDFELSKQDFLTRGGFMRPTHHIRAAANDEDCSLGV